MKEVNLISIHNQFFTDNGFVLNKEFLHFEKRFPLGKQVIFVHYTDHPDSNILEYKLGIRIDEIEQIIHRFLPSLNDYSNRSITLVQTLNKIGKELPQRFTISNDWELSEVIMRVEAFFATTGFKWLDDMMDPINLERAFVEQRNNLFKTQNFVYNAFRATALSKLYHPIDYPKMRKSFLEQIVSHDLTPFTLASFLQFLDFLDHLD